MYKRIKYLLVGLCLSLGIAAQQTGSSVPQLSDEARISLITCAPGEDLYARYGHTAIRVCDVEHGLDVVFNYGLFSFETEHFYWKFVRGETWYQLGVEDYESFLMEYMYYCRPLYEQELVLTQDEKNQIFKALRTNLRPENRYYLYNFVFDNCATRPYRILTNVIGKDLTSSYEGYEGQTYREFISHYTGKGSWTDFGINLLFGRKADQPMHGDERLFLPEELMFHLSEARRANGEKIVAQEHIEPFYQQPLPWKHTWYFGLALFAIIMVLITLWDRYRQKHSYWIDILLGVLYLLLFLLVGFLVFFSRHPLVGFGWRLLIIPFIHLCTRIIYYIPCKPQQ